MDVFAYCQDLVRRHDRERYYATLFAPTEIRSHLCALYAFNVEVSRIRELVSDPLPGEVRLKWWADAVSGTSHGDVQANPVAAALVQTIEANNLPVGPITDLIDCRANDLYDETMEHTDQLIGYCTKTGASLLILGAQIAGVTLSNDMRRGLRSVGVAYALTGLLRMLPLHARVRRCAMPKDILQRHGLSSEDLFAGGNTPAIRDLYRDVKQMIGAETADCARAISRTHAGVSPVLLPVALVPKYLAIMDRPDFDPFVNAVNLSPLAMLWTMWTTHRSIRR
jgi:phytoene synthase